MSVHRTKRPWPLGKRVASYRSQTPSPLTLGAWMALPLVLAVQMGQAWLGPDWWWTVAVAIAPGLLWLTWTLQVPRRVDLYQNGLDYRVGRRHRYLFWNQVYEVYQVPLYRLSPRTFGFQPSVGWMYRIVPRDGRVLRLHNFESMRTLGQRIQEQVTRRLLPLAYDAFCAGYTVRFGRHVAISMDGVRLGRKSWAWREIVEISIDETSEVRLTERACPDIPRSLPARQVPNLYLLDRILRASQQTLEPDEGDIDRRRGALFHDPESEDVPFPLTPGGTQLLPRDSHEDMPGDRDGRSDLDDQLNHDLPRRRPK